MIATELSQPILPAITMEYDLEQPALVKRRMSRSYSICCEEDDTNVRNGMCPKYALNWGIKFNSLHWSQNHDFISGHELPPNIKSLCCERIQLLNKDPEAFEKACKDTLVFCDMDGVLADFEAGFWSLKGCMPDDYPKHLLWPTILQDKRFFAELPPMPNALTLWQEIKDFKPIILTGCPNSNAAKAAKVEWCKQHLGPNCLRIQNLAEMALYPDYDYYIIITTAAKKHTFTRPNSILIDDRLETSESWENANGIFLHYDESKTQEIINIVKMLRT